MNEKLAFSGEINFCEDSTIFCQRKLLTSTQVGLLQEATMSIQAENSKFNFFGFVISLKLKLSNKIQN